MTDLTQAQTARKQWMGLLAKSRGDRLATLLEELDATPRFQWLRRPEIGAVMVRGRTGGTGMTFNLGEMTVTRCSIRLDSGEVGHGYVQGRDKVHAQRAAIVDALMQTDRAETVRARVLDPLASEKAAVRHARRAKTAATKVDFFTMVRGED